MSSSNPARPSSPWLTRLPCVAAAAAAVALAYALPDVLGPRGRAGCGVVAFIAVIAALSADLRRVSVRTVAWGLALQFLLAWLILRFTTPAYSLDVGPIHLHSDGRPVYEFFSAVAGVIKTFLEFSDAGAKFVFGPLADPAVMDKAFPNNGFVFAFRALPPILFVSSFFTVLYHFGVLQWIVRVLARVMIFIMGTSGAETLSAVANVFMGQTEAPLIVKPYVKGMTMSELLALMVGGMATISGGIMAVYIALGADPVAILATSVMAAPCGLYLSKLLLPETGQPQTSGRAEIQTEKLHRNAVDAAAGGASDGLHLALNVAAMLIAFLAFIAMFNHLLGRVDTAWLRELGLHVPEKLSLEWVFGKLFAPVAYLMGVESKDTTAIGSLLGTKLIANEFVAYVQLTSPEFRASIDPRSFKLAVYALTGFANVASIGIQLGGIGAMAPERRPDLARLGTRALLAGFVATLVNASIAGIMME